MFNLLNSNIYTSYYLLMAFLIICIILALAISVYMIYRNKKKTDERLSRLNDIDYTQILKSTGGDIGTVTTYTNGSGNVNYSSYHARPTTKFLVVYLNGDREIVTVNDNSTLCQEYLLRLKKDD